MNGRFTPNAKYPTPKSYTKPVYPVQDKTLKYLYFMDKEHPLASKTGRVLHHRHVASVKIGRWLQPKEVAHHENENRSDNRPKNLGVKTTLTIAHSKADWPSNEELRKMIWASSAVLVAKQMGVSSSAVKRRCKARGIETPPRGRWAKERQWARG